MGARRIVSILAVLAALTAPAAAEEREDPLRWLHAQPLTLFDLGIMRLERDVHAAAPWLAEIEAGGEPVLAGVRYDHWQRRIVVYISLRRPRAERTEAACVALFRRLVERMIDRAPEGPRRAAWYLQKIFVPAGRERIAPESFGQRLLETVHAEITLRGRSDDARAAEAGRMTCSGRLDAADSEIERQFVN
jgi:hypothetical protein